jgi:hypothetical protein
MYYCIASIVTPFCLSHCERRAASCREQLTTKHRSLDASRHPCFCFRAHMISATPYHRDCTVIHRTLFSLQLLSHTNRCTPAYLHTPILDSHTRFTYPHTHIPFHIPTYPHTHSHTHIPIHIPTYPFTYPRTHIPIHIPTDPHTHTRYPHTHVPTYPHTHIPTYPQRFTYPQIPDSHTRFTYPIPTH